MSSTAADIAKLGEAFKLLRVEGEKSMSGLIKQTAIFAIQSATKATEPGSSGSVKGMAKKFKVRPLVPVDGYLYRNPQTGFIFRRQQPVKSFKARGLERIRRGIKFWDKRKSAWGVMAYIKGVTPEKRRSIPFYGSAKSGFLKALGSLGKKDAWTEGKPSNKIYASVIKRLHGFDQFVSITNEVGYASVISPGAAETGMQKASARMLKTYASTIERLTAKAAAK
jgi:hypothetical protein